MRSSHRLVGVRRHGGRDARLRPAGCRRRRCATRAGSGSRAASGSRPAPATRTGSRSSRCPRRRTRASRRSRDTCATRGSRRASTSASRGSRPPTSRRRSARGTTPRRSCDIAQGLEPDLYPLLASSQVRASGTNLSGYQDPSLDPLLEAARKPGTAEDRAAAWKALLAGLATRTPLLPLVWNDDVTLARGLEGDSPRLISAPGDRFWDVLAWRLAADR